MKIAMPYQDGVLLEHFGRAKEFIIYNVSDLDPVTSEVIAPEDLSHAAVARTLKGHGVDVVLCGSIGEHARHAVEGEHMLVFSGITGAADDVLERASRAVGAELRALLGENVKSVLVAGLGNANMTPDAIGPRSAEHVLVTRHLRQNGAFSAFCSVSVLTPGVLGRTGIEAMETLRGTVRAVQPDAVIAIDALASRSLMRLCSTVQLSDTGIVPGSGVGNHRCPLSRDTLGVPVYAIGVPTVVDAATLTLDVLEEAGKSDVDPAALRGHETVMVTTRDIDAQIRELSRVIGYGIDLALQPLDFSELCALMG